MAEIGMTAFLSLLGTTPELTELARQIESGNSPAAVTGVQPVQRACVGAAAALLTRRPMVFICGDEREARQLDADLSALTGQSCAAIFPREWDFHPGSVGSREWERKRIASFWRIASGDTGVIVAAADALLQRTIPPDTLLSLSVTLNVGGRADLSALSEGLIKAGYARCDEVEGAGQFAIRGGILDVFSPQMESPIRCEFFDDEIDSIGTFDPATQRRTENIRTALLLPASEVLPHCAEGGAEGLAAKLEKLASRSAKRRPELAERLRADAERFRDGVDPGGLDRYLCAIYPQAASGLDYLPQDSLIVLCECGRVEERIKGALARTRQDAETLMESGAMAGEFADVQLDAETFYHALKKFPVVMADSLPTSRYPMKPRSLIHINARQLSSYGGSLETAASDLEQYRKSGTAALVLCASDSRALNLHRLLEDKGIFSALSLKGVTIPAAGEIRIARGALSAGCEWPYLKLAVLTEGQLFQTPQKAPKRKKTASNRQKLQSYSDLSPGDLVVHEHHGIGRFAGIQRMPVDGVEKDYIKIDYAGGDCLYVPATQLDQVSKYIGGGEESGPARLNRLGGAEWARQKRKAKKAVQDLAKGLTQLYAERQRRPGFAFSPDSTWQREFEESFPYEETDDQLKAIDEIKKDMEAPRPMDRLLCGDVGYGKTEVALRAVMKCVLDGKQAAILVPTTVLAQQHYATACGRFQNYPVRIETLSRFTPPKDAKRILSATRSGSVDLLIGTHKLLQKSMEFRNLGLLVIDEEQRFGVTHKERLKEISRQVDVLTLSATPIPRTLNMALSGLRDMSSIDEPPAGRQPVQTYVIEHDWGVVADAMRRELERGGQVYYIHNRIESIDRTAAEVQRLLGPEARIVVGHGRMGEQELSEVMRRMTDGEADVLVCTTIIETGIDIPNVNTLIIEDADRMGLAQLHQIRGRIGRSARRAYAWMTYRPGKILQETAAKRLSAIREYVEFGSGFKIAMRDLEIRGAGNLLGPEQSGYLMSVGYDMYLKLLEEAVLEEQGARKEIECAADLTVNANIPEKYVPSPEQRMDLYRRIAAIRDNDDSSDLLDELMDRYGEAPQPVLALLDVALLRASAARQGVSDITQKGGEIRLTFAEFHPETVVKLCGLSKYRRKLTLSAGEPPSMTLKLPKGADVLESARELVDDLRLSSPDAQ